MRSMAVSSAWEPDANEHISFIFELKRLMKRKADKLDNEHISSHLVIKKKRKADKNVRIN